LAYFYLENIWEIFSKKECNLLNETELKNIYGVFARLHVPKAKLFEY